MSVEIGPLRPIDAQGGVARGGQDRSETDNAAFADSRGEGAPAQDVALQDVPATERRTNALLGKLADGGRHEDARLSIDRDDVTGDFVYRILDSRTGEVMRQFPHEEMLELLRYLGEQTGLIVDQQV